MTSAMQIVADRDTPTRQCTRVAIPSFFPRSAYDSVSCKIFGMVIMNDPYQ
jgi:hypothetical protein